MQQLIRFNKLCFIWKLYEHKPLKNRGKLYSNHNIYALRTDIYYYFITGLNIQNLCRPLQNKVCKILNYFLNVKRVYCVTGYNSSHNVRVSKHLAYNHPMRMIIYFIITQ